MYRFSLGTSDGRQITQCLATLSQYESGWDASQTLERYMKEHANLGIELTRRIIQHDE